MYLNTKMGQLMKEKIKTIDDFKREFSREIFDKASNPFLKTNKIIPLNIKDECLYVISTVGSSLEAIDSLKLIYSLKSVIKIKVDKKDFDEIFSFCFGSHHSHTKEEKITCLDDPEKNDIDKATYDKQKAYLAIIFVTVMSIAIITMFFSGTDSHTVEEKQYIQIEKIIDRVGYPDRQVKAPKGNMVYIYERGKRTTVKSSPFNSLFGTDEKNIVDVVDCTYSFEIDSKNRVVKVLLFGNNCPKRDMEQFKRYNDSFSTPK